MTLEKLVKDRKLENFMRAWDAHANREDTKGLYIGILWAYSSHPSKSAKELIHHPDFKILSQPKADERLSREKLIAILGAAADLMVVRPEFFPGPVEWFDFLIIANEFVQRACEKWPQFRDPAIDEGMMRILAYSTRKLFEAVTSSFGTMERN